MAFKINGILVSGLGTNGAGVPVGGTSTQILQKNSNVDFDTSWVDAPIIPTKTSEIENDSDFATNASVDEKLQSHRNNTEVHITAEERELWNGANAYTDTAIANLVGSAPDTLNTLEEISKALNEDANYVINLSSKIDQKQDILKGQLNQVVSFDANGNIIYKTLNASDVGAVDANYVETEISAVEAQIDTKSNKEHTHTYESIEGLEDAIKNVADSKFYVVTFDKGEDNEYHGDLTFAEIREKFEAGGNMVARIDGTDYIPLLSAAPHQIIFSGIYQSQSVSLTIDSSGACILTTTSLTSSNNLYTHTNNHNNPHRVSCEQIGAATVNDLNTLQENFDTLSDELNNSIENISWNNLKNRPFYNEVKIETIFPFTTISNIRYAGNKFSIYSAELLDTYLGLEEGKKYTVIFNGVTYPDLICSINATDEPIIGAYVDSYGDSNFTNYPFNITDSSRTNGSVLYIEDLEEIEYTIEILEEIENIVQINESYIPDTIARVEYINTQLNEKPNAENPVLSGSLGLNHTGELGWTSVSLGSANEASGMYCFSEGMGNKSTGDASHSEGTGNTASGYAAHAEGSGTLASETGAHAEGANTKATGYGSHAEGSNTIASVEGQHVEGKYNIDDATSIHIVGNGTSNTKRSNAHTLNLNGEAWFAGDVYVGSTSGAHKDEGSKKLATETFVSNSLSGIQSQIDAINASLAVAVEELSKI